MSLNLLRNLFAGTSRHGFVYVSDEEDGPMRRAREGAVISLSDRGPPWIVVDWELRSMILAKWPGKIWRVEMLQAATLKDQKAVGGAPLPYAKYTRAISVRVLEEQNCAALFGSTGEDVLTVIKKARNLLKEEAEVLADNRHVEASEAYDRVWRAWMQANDVPSDDYDDLDGTLSLGSSTWGSPINQGLSLVANVVDDRAKEVDGKAASQSDDEDVWLVHPWNGAESALRDAALALGAPDFVSEADRNVLLQSWFMTFGRLGGSVSH